MFDSSWPAKAKLENEPPTILLGLQRYLIIRYVSLYLHHDMIHIAIRFSVLRSSVSALELYYGVHHTSKFV